MRIKMLVLAGAIAAAITLVVSGCLLGAAVGDAEADADAIAAAVASPSDGFTQEAMDVGGYLFASVGGSGDASMSGPQAALFPAGHVRFFSGDLSSFVWDEATKSYVRTQADFEVTHLNYSIHVETLLVRVRFFTSADATGEGYGPVDFTGGFDPAIHSMAYHRELSGTSTHLSSGTVSAHTAGSDFAFTGIDTVAGTVTIDGTRTRSFDRTFTSGRTAVGTISDTISDLVMSWDVEAGTVSWTGTLTYVFDATVTRANGTVVARHQECTIEFCGSSTFTVTVDGVTYRYRLADGTRVP